MFLLYVISGVEKYNGCMVGLVQQCEIGVGVIRARTIAEHSVVFFWKLLRFINEYHTDPSLLLKVKEQGHFQGNGTRGLIERNY